MKKYRDDEFINYSLTNILEDRYSKYAKYIIQERALPDGRDGLKPVQRRILYSMHQLKLTYNSSYKKSARIVGEVIGKYHPHGDTSVYDAMVRMSQDWKMSNPLISFQGNNGSIDGDNPAAMRYTEVKLSKISAFLLKDLNKEIITYVPNFDDTEIEPTVLPSPLPNLLVNGATGIAAGYATNIPPHNLSEIVDALIYRANNRECSIDDIINIISGPDFPTGGIVENKPGIIEAYKTGKGMIVLKSKIEINDKKIVITEIPYEVNKKSIIQAIDDIRLDSTNNINIKRVEDYSDKNGISINIEIAKAQDATYIKNFLLKKTNLQITYNYNMIAIIDKKPVQCNILNLLDCYLMHQGKLLALKIKFELKQLEKKMTILRGLLKCSNIIDNVIKTIKESKNKDNAIENLINKYNFNYIQAEAIVLLRLYRLSSTDVKNIANDLKNFTSRQEELLKLFRSFKLRNNLIISELVKIKNEFAIPRRTEIKNKIEKIILDETTIQTEREIFITISKKGYLRLVYITSKTNTNIMKLKYNDWVISRIKTSNKNKLCLITNKGNIFAINLNNITPSLNNDFGIHVSKYVKIDINETVINSFIYNDISKIDKYLVIFTKNGYAKKILINSLNLKINKIFLIMNLINNDQIINSFVISDNKKLLIATTKVGYATIFNSTILKEFKKIHNKGSKFIKLKPKDEIINVDKVNENFELLLISNDNKYRIIHLTEINNSNDIISTGRKIKHLKSTVKILYAFLINKDSELFAFKDDKIIETSTFNKMFLSKRSNTFQKIPSDKINNWTIEKHDICLI